MNSLRSFEFKKNSPAIITEINPYITHSTNKKSQEFLKATTWWIKIHPKRDAKRANKYLKTVGKNAVTFKPNDFAAYIGTNVKFVTQLMTRVVSTTAYTPNDVLLTSSHIENTFVRPLHMVTTHGIFNFLVSVLT